VAALRARLRGAALLRASAFTGGMSFVSNSARFGLTAFRPDHSMHSDRLRWLQQALHPQGFVSHPPRLTPPEFAGIALP